MLAVLLLAAATPQAQTPQAFITTLYANYRDTNFSPFDHRNAIFAPRLAAAIRLDEKLTPSGYVGTLDWDPICGCQDWTSLRPEIRHIVMSSPNRATVTIGLHDGDHFQPLGLILDHTKDGWRVADVLNHGSLLALLDRENGAALKRRHRH